MPVDKSQLESQVRASFVRQEQYAKRVGLLYEHYADRILKLVNTWPGVDPTKPFSFAKYPGLKRKVDALIKEMNIKVLDEVKKGVDAEWEESNKVSDSMVRSAFGMKGIEEDPRFERFFDRNLKARDAFKRRVDAGGMGLSDRIWNYGDQLKAEMDLALEMSIAEGKSAQKISQEVRKYLKEPDKLFRRVRDEKGILRLSRAAAAYHPGPGKYRSSYKNAMRVTRTETNMAYKSADMARYQQLDFVVGYEVKLSKSHPIRMPGGDICDELKGKYPKEFKFTSWHPQCLCYVVSILNSDDEFDAMIRKILKGEDTKGMASGEQITDVPDGFKKWVEQNAERSKGWKNQPYFIRDNFKGGRIEGGLKIATAQIAKPVIQQAESIIPEALRKGGDYVSGTGIVFKREFFELLDPERPVMLKIDRKIKISRYSDTDQTVNIGDFERLEKSKWVRESTIYHEFGHAIDWQRGLSSQSELNELILRHRYRLEEEMVRGMVNTYDSVEGRLVVRQTVGEVRKISAISDKLVRMGTKIYSMSDETFIRRGITKGDVLEQICATLDVIQSLNPMYGMGHSRSYMLKEGMREAEFIAHCFENAFSGNTVMKKYLSELYEDMIKYVRELK